MKVSKPKRCVAEAELRIDANVLWSFLGDTNALNQLMGLPRVQFSPVEASPRCERRAEARLVPGWRWRWKETPFDWVVGRSYAVEREFENGSVRRMRWGIELHRTTTGTRVRVFAELTPRSLFHWPLAAVLGKINVRRVLRLCRRLAPGAKAPMRPAGPTRKLGKAELTAIADAGQRLKSISGVSAPVVERLTQHLLHASDSEVLRLRPFDLADRWRLPREAVLRVCLLAARDGFLQLDWVLMCPNCRVPKARFTSLQALDPRFHCDLCGVDYEADMDRYTELRFSVSPRLRSADETPYCLGSPSSSPHQLVQQSLKPGESVGVVCRLGKEALRVRALRSNISLPFPAPEPTGGDRVQILFDGRLWRAHGTPRSDGEVQIEWLNQGAEPVVAVLEKVEWDDKAVTAARVSQLAEFRELFGSEVLGRGVQVGIRHLAILFTDLKRSTSLYETVGDAAAYAHVRRHFDFLSQCIERHGGLVVKTMGDAVMATFLSGDGLTRAAVDILLGFGRFLDSLKAGGEIAIKLGAHQGPAICVTANEQLDYFGRTVNLASRIQNESHGNDLVMSESLFAVPSVREILLAAGLKCDSWQTELRGLEGEFTLFRLQKLVPAVRPVSSATPATPRRVAASTRRG